MDPFTAATLLFSGIKKVADFFNKGKELMDEVKGETSTATTPDELQAEFETLSLDQQKVWVDKMAAAINQYEAETERLKAQESVSSELSSKVDSETASKISYLRQTTRPWAVRQMVRVILFPFYLIGIDVIQHLLKNWLFFWTDKVKPFESFHYVFGFTGAGLMDKLGNIIGPMPKTLAGQMYIEAIGVAVWVIISYMGLREAGKYRDKERGDGILGNIKKIGFFSKILGGK